MKHSAATDFWRSYETLPAEIRSRADKQFLLMTVDPQHPSLQFKKIAERSGQEIWSARVSLNFRALALKRPDGFLWFWIGDHKAYERMIG